MTGRIDPGFLLRQLAGPVTPTAGGAGAAGQATRAAGEERPFATLLAQAQRGVLRTDRPVLEDVSTTADAQEPLDEPQLQRVGAAADLLESTGATRALLMLDGRPLVLDVQERTITQELAPGRPMAVDAAISVASASDEPHGPADPRQVMPPPGFENNAPAARPLHEGAAASGPGAPTLASVAAHD